MFRPGLAQWHSVRVIDSASPDLPATDVAGAERDPPRGPSR